MPAPSGDEHMPALPAWALRLLRCPNTKEDLQLADYATVQRMLALQNEDQLINQWGVACDRTFDSGLVNASWTFFYPMHDGIPTLIPEEAISLPGPPVD